MNSLQLHKMSFDGQLLARGFWIYIWKISNSSDEWLYVGRTGDTSSAFASSPFNRIGQHLDCRANAKGNALARQLKKAGVNLLHSKYEMIAIGPIFEEQLNFELHKPFRDIISALEKEVAMILKSRNYNVIGTHQCKFSADEKLLHQLMNIIDGSFPSKTKKNS